jgi:hypothetical protein
MKKSGHKNNVKYDSQAKYGLGGETLLKMNFMLILSERIG